MSFFACGGVGNSARVTSEVIVFDVNARKK